jgi:decaprenyl-phosphate phosphoribosyltransferase
MSTFADYLKLFKFRYHLSFILVIVGAFLFSHQSFWRTVTVLLIAYLSFNVLIYGGLYTLNDIFDINADRSHPRKKNRPLASGRISLQQAWMLASMCIPAGLIIMYLFFGPRAFLTCVAFIVINQFYTRVAKKIPYLEIIFNSLTHPMRFFLGVLLVGGPIPYLFTSAIFFFAIGFAILRRIVEKKSPGWQARPVLAHYTLKGLVALQIVALIIMIVLAILNYPLLFGWYAVMVVGYIIICFGIHFSRSFEPFFHWLFLN